MAKHNIDKFLDEVDEPVPSSSQNNTTNLKRAEIVDTRNDINNELESLLAEIKTVLSQVMRERSEWNVGLDLKVKDLDRRYKKWQKEVEVVRQEDEERKKKIETLTTSAREDLDRLRQEKFSFNEDKVKLVEAIDSKVREIKNVIVQAGNTVAVKVGVSDESIQKMRVAADEAARKAAEDFRDKIRLDNYVALPTWIFVSLLIIALGTAAALGALVYFNYGACNYGELYQVVSDAFAEHKTDHVALSYLTLQIPSVTKILKWWMIGTGGAFVLWILIRLFRIMSND